MESTNKPCRALHRSYQKSETESNKEFRLRIRKTFLNNIFKNKYYLSGKQIKFKNYYNNFGEIECFYHVTTDEQSGTNERKPSIQRYDKCLLIFLLLDSCACNKVTCTCVTIKKDYNDQNRISLYCAEFRYALILEPKGSKMSFITAFPVSEDQEYKFL